jgi:hypothetical protein
LALLYQVQLIEQQFKIQIILQELGLILDIMDQELVQEILTFLFKNYKLWLEQQAE